MQITDTKLHILETMNAIIWPSMFLQKTATFPLYNYMDKTAMELY